MPHNGQWQMICYLSEWGDLKMFQGCKRELYLQVCCSCHKKHGWGTERDKSPMLKFDAKTVSIYCTQKVWHGFDFIFPDSIFTVYVKNPDEINVGHVSLSIIN